MTGSRIAPAVAPGSRRTVDYTQCMDAKHGLAASSSASPEEIVQLATDRNAAIEELAAQAAIYEDRFGFLPKRIDAVVAWLRGP
jgi:hypothetical protein